MAASELKENDLASKSRKLVGKWRQSVASDRRAAQGAAAALYRATSRDVIEAQGTF